MLLSMHSIFSIFIINDYDLLENHKSQANSNQKYSEIKRKLLELRLEGSIGRIYNILLFELTTKVLTYITHDYCII